MTIWGFALGSIFGVIGAAFLTVPVFYPLHFTSIYEYLEKRFQSKVVRRIAVLSFVLKVRLRYTEFVRPSVNQSLRWQTFAANDN